MGGRKKRRDGSRQEREARGVKLFRQKGWRWPGYEKQKVKRGIPLTEETAAPESSAGEKKKPFSVGKKGKRARWKKGGWRDIPREEGTGVRAADKKNPR